MVHSPREVVTAGRKSLHRGAVTVREIVTRAVAFVRVQAIDAGLTLTVDAGDWDASVIADARTAGRYVEEEGS
jgi:hypothetical protein